MSNSIVDKIRRFPTLFGVLLALIIFAAISTIGNWFPRIEEAWQRNNANVRSVYFTMVLFIVLISRLWPSRRRNLFLFWVALCVVFLLHVAGVVFYSIGVHALLMKEWIILLVFETFLIGFGLEWLMDRFGAHSQAGGRETDE